MEFERRTGRGRGADRAEYEGALRDSEAMHEGLQTKEEEKEARSSPASTSAKPFAEMATNGISKEDRENSKRGDTLGTEDAEGLPLHNIDIAQQLLATNQSIQASSIPLRLASIRIEGAKSVRPSFLGRLCRPYMDASLSSSLLNCVIYSHRLGHVMPGQYASLSAILQLTNSIGMDLTNHDLFSNIDASVQPSKTNASAEDVDIVFACKERGNYFLKTSTDVGNGEGNATVQARVRNCFGGAERAEFSATMGTKTRRAFNASLSSPLFASPDHNVSLGAYALDRDLTSYASLIEGVRGVRAALQVQPGESMGTHEIGFDLMHRHLTASLPIASLAIRRQAGHSIKSSLSHRFTFDSRDDPFTGARGHYLRLFQEFAGFGGDAEHYKVDTEAQMSRSFGHGWAFSLAAQAGLLRPLNHRAPSFCDRFQLGGPVSVRMFRFNSLGPKEGSDSLGGDMFYSLGASLFAPMPSRPDWPLKVHAFCNAGQLIQLDPSQSIFAQKNQNLISAELLTQPSSSVGLGLMYRQGNLRAEVNLGVPLSAREHDGARRGVQLGIGISFM